MSNRLDEREPQSRPTGGDVVPHDDLEACHEQDNSVPMHDHLESRQHECSCSHSRQRGVIPERPSLGLQRRGGGKEAVGRRTDGLRSDYAAKNGTR